ncbi:MAG TPA: acyl carrier protein [Steroidobacteraceae bacterium]|nr:acyl carrier protein [Steroidobacteraceae bacterium]
MTQEEVLVWLANLLNEPAGSSLAPDATQEDIAGWDSMAMLLLMADLDEKFEIQLEEKEVEGLTGVGDILKILKRHGKLA